MKTKTTKKKAKATSKKYLPGVTYEQRCGAVGQKAVAVIKHELPQADATLALIDRAARDPSVDVSKMRELLQMKKDHEQDLRDQRAEEARMSYQRDMIEAQSEMEPVARTADNKQTTSKYAKLEHISKVIKPVYSKFGFALSFTSPKPLADGTMLVGVWVMHRDGHKEYHELPGQIETTGFKGNANMTGLQGLGKLISYLRRYLTCMVFDVILYNEDTDGQPDADKAAAPAQDKFTYRANEANTGTVIDNDVPDWKPAHGVVIDAKTKLLSYNDKPDSGAPELQAAAYLRAVIAKRNHKQSRVNLINENLSLVRALVKAKQGSVVSDLHALADKGE